MSKHNLLVLILVLAVGFGAGYIIGSPEKGGGHEKHAHNDIYHDDAHDDGHLHSDVYEVASNEPQPTLEVEVHEDPKSGWNIELLTTNFEFSLENASLEHVPGEGHAHIYVDGKKIARVYGNWFHVDGFTGEEHAVRVTLNTNDHKDYAVNGSVVEVTTTVHNEVATGRSIFYDEDDHRHE